MTNNIPAFKKPEVN